MERTRCRKCGRFDGWEPGASRMNTYSGHPPTPDDIICRCKRCTEKYGPPKQRPDINDPAWIIPKAPEVGA